MVSKPSDTCWVVVVVFEVVVVDVVVVAISATFNQNSLQSL